MDSGHPEIFHSIQGEGVNAGLPSSFLRLATCNLACTWCDSKYTWDFKHYQYSQQVVELSLSQILERLDKLNCDHVVITGGEPLLQQHELIPLASELSQRGYFSEVETNGTIKPDPELAVHISQWNVSPKTSNSGNRIKVREVSASYISFRELPKAYFKFVVSVPDDIHEIVALVDSYDLCKDRVILMPQGVTPTDLAKRSSWVADSCTKYGYRFSPRLHILLWGDERGK